MVIVICQLVMYDMHRFKLFSCLLCILVGITSIDNFYFLYVQDGYTHTYTTIFVARAIMKVFLRFGKSLWKNGRQ